MSRCYRIVAVAFIAGAFAYVGSDGVSVSGSVVRTVRSTNPLETGDTLTQDDKTERQALPAPDAREVYAQMPFAPPLPGHGTVTCDVALSADGIVSGTISAGDGALRTALLIKGKVVAQVPAGSGTGAFAFRDLASGTLSWHDIAAGGAGACSAGSVETLRTGIFGRIEGPRLPGSYVLGCGGMGEIADDSFFMNVEAPLRCSVWVQSVDDEGIATGPVFELTTAIGKDSEVVLRYPRHSDFRSFTDDELAGRHELSERMKDYDTKISPEGPPHDN
jgi:hypothetical protein